MSIGSNQKSSVLISHYTYFHFDLGMNGPRQSRPAGHLFWDTLKRQCNEIPPPTHTHTHTQQTEQSLSMQLKHFRRCIKPDRTELF